MTGEIKDAEGAEAAVREMENHPWLQEEVTALANYFVDRGLSPFEGAWVMSKLTSVALTSCVVLDKQKREENAEE